MQNMTEQEHDAIIRIAIEEAPNVIEQYNRDQIPANRLYKGEDNSYGELGSALFDRVLPIIDEHYPDLSRFEAAPISDVCYEVAGDIVHGDILGDLLDYREPTDDEIYNRGNI